MACRAEMTTVLQNPRPGRATVEPFPLSHVGPSMHLLLAVLKVAAAFAFVLGLLQLGSRLRRRAKRRREVSDESD